MLGQVGGGLKLQKLFKNENIGSLIGVFFMIILVIFIKTYIVQITYNIMWPKIVENSGGDNSRFRPLNFYEALMMVILFSFLFGF